VGGKKGWEGGVKQKGCLPGTGLCHIVAERKGTEGQPKKETKKGRGTNEKKKKHRWRASGTSKHPEGATSKLLTPKKRGEKGGEVMHGKGEIKIKPPCSWTWLRGGREEGKKVNRVGFSLSALQPVEKKSMKRETNRNRGERTMSLSGVATENKLRRRRKNRKGKKKCKKERRWGRRGEKGDGRFRSEFPARQKGPKRGGGRGGKLRKKNQSSYIFACRH